MCRTVRSPYFVSLVVTPAPNFRAGPAPLTKIHLFAAWDRPTRRLQSSGQKVWSSDRVHFRDSSPLGFFVCCAVGKVYILMWKLVNYGRFDRADP